MCNQVRLVAAELEPDEPKDAPWGERFFHVTGPDGHELSFAQPLPPRSVVEHNVETVTAVN